MSTSLCSHFSFFLKLLFLIFHVSLKGPYHSSLANASLPISNDLLQHYSTHKGRSRFVTGGTSIDDGTAILLAGLCILCSLETQLFLLHVNTHEQLSKLFA